MVVVRDCEADAVLALLREFMPHSVIARLGTSRGNLCYSVCHAEQREASPRHGRLYVILSATKDLKGCTTIRRLGDLEILHCVQNDRMCVQNDRVSTQNDNREHHY